MGAFVSVLRQPVKLLKEQTETKWTDVSCRVKSVVQKTCKVTQTPAAATSPASGQTGNKVKHGKNIDGLQKTPRQIHECIFLI